MLKLPNCNQISRHFPISCGDCCMAPGGIWMAFKRTGQYRYSRNN